MPEPFFRVVKKGIKILFFILISIFKEEMNNNVGAILLEILGQNLELK